MSALRWRRRLPRCFPECGDFGVPRHWFHYPKGFSAIDHALEELGTHNLSSATGIETHCVDASGHLQHFAIPIPQPVIHPQRRALEATSRVRRRAIRLSLWGRSF